MKMPITQPVSEITTAPQKVAQKKPVEVRPRSKMLGPDSHTTSWSTAALTITRSLYSLASEVATVARQLRWLGFFEGVDDENLAEAQAAERAERAREGVTRLAREMCHVARMLQEDATEPVPRSEERDLALDVALQRALETDIVYPEEWREVETEWNSPTRRP